MTVAETIRVVLADDHPVVRNGLAMIISQQPDMVVVAEAEDGEQAVALFERHRPDVMIVDLRMPKCDGLEVVRRVREAYDDRSGWSVEHLSTSVKNPARGKGDHPAGRKLVVFGALHV